MPLPQPRPGLVLHYSYLWRNEHRRGLEEGVKDRPCVIVGLREPRPGETVVLVAPVTHRPPTTPHAVELPPVTKRRLGLDEQSSWIIADELNRFRWPGHDLRPIPGRDPAVFSYGFLPPGLFRQLTAAILAASRSAGADTVPR